MGTGLPGQEPVLHPDGFRCRRDPVHRQERRLRRFGLGIEGRQVQKAAERCGGNPAWNLPLVFGPVALGYNLPGVDKLVLNADLLAKIFTGAITTWNDPAIAALNSGASLPDTKITVIYRSDSSGTTDNFQKYLDAAVPQTWTKGAGKEIPGRWEGAQKSAGVVQAVQATPGAIGYVEKGVRRPGQADRDPDRQRQRRGGAHDESAKEGDRRRQDLRYRKRPGARSEPRW